jgi:hypothetical protein
LDEERQKIKVLILDARTNLLLAFSLKEHSMNKKIYGKEKVIKFLDLLIRDIENVEYFNIQEYINRFRGIDDHEKAYLPHSIESLGKTYGLFEATLNTEGWFKLTIKGIQLKEYGKGLNKFERRLKRKLSLFEQVSIFFFVIGFLFGVYQYQRNQSLENRVFKLENKLKFKTAIFDTIKVANNVHSGKELKPGKFINSNQSK